MTAGCRLCLHSGVAASALWCYCAAPRAKCRLKPLVSCLFRSRLSLFARPCCCYVMWATCYPRRRLPRLALPARGQVKRKRGVHVPRAGPRRPVVFWVEVGGRWDAEAATFLRLPARACASSAVAATLAAAQAAWVLHWSGFVFVAARRSLAATMLESRSWALLVGLQLCRSSLPTYPDRSPPLPATAACHCEPDHRPVCAP